MRTSQEPGAAVATQMTIIGGMKHLLIGASGMEKRRQDDSQEREMACLSY